MIAPISARVIAVMRVQFDGALCGGLIAVVIDMGLDLP